MIEKILYGRKKPLTLPTGEKRMAQYVIVDLDEIKASHNEETFGDTEGYPLNSHGRNINDRNYKNDTAAQQTVMSIAQNLDADKLIEYGTGVSGTPIMDKSGIVVSGNNRIMSLKLAARKFPDQYNNYKNVLKGEATTFGIDENKINELSKPVLVRIDEDIPELNTTELAKYNLNAKKGERPVDKAVKLGNILRENERCRNVILSVIDGYETFSDLYSSQGRNDRKKLVQAFIDCGLIPEQQMVSYYSEGEFTDSGKDFVESVLSAMILSPDALNVAGLEGVKRLRQTIISSLPVLITNENLKEASLQSYLSEAIVIEHKIRQVGDFSDYMRSQSMFGEDTFNAKSYYLNRLLNLGRNTFKDAIKKYNEGIKSNTGNSMFTTETLPPDEVFEKTIARNISPADVALIDRKANKPVKMEPKADTIEPAILPAAKPSNLWANDAWFTNHPEKVLGIPYEASGRFGAVTKYKGTIDDLNKIEVPDNFIGNMKAITDPLASVVDQHNPELDALLPGMDERIIKILDQSEKEIDQKIVKKGRAKKKAEVIDETIAVKETAELQTFEQIYKKYNEQISADELEAFVWWKSHTKKPLSRRWINLIKPGTYSGDSLSIPTPEHYGVSEEKVKQWITQGLLYYINGQFEPEVIYLSGDVYDKKAQLVRDQDKIIELYGQQVYDNQATAFSRAFKSKYEKRLTVTGNSETGLVLLANSSFADKFTVSSIAIIPEGSKFKIKQKDGKPDLVKDPESSDHKREEFEELSLKYAFGHWLNHGNPEIREAISSMDVIRYYVLNMNMRNAFNKELARKDYEAEKVKLEKLKSSCQREGERLFLHFLEDQLHANDKVRLETEWNATYNNYLPVDYNKIPVAFTMCKYYKGKEEHLRPEKREAVAFSLVEGSACLAYDVGVGKTPSAIFTISAFMDAGFALRPFVCVPNQVYKQFISEIKGFAPHIPVLEAYNLGEEFVRNFQGPDGNITKVPAGTITVMTYEGLEQIGFSDGTYHTLFAELYEILNQGGEDERQASKKQKEGFAAKLETLLGKGLRGTLFNIEDFGFDFGCYDEAHKMKKVFTAVKGELKADEDTGKKKRGDNPYVINSGVPSAIGLKGFMLNYYIQKNNNWQNVLLLTATPFTNSPLEIFSMLSMVAYNKLRETDLNNIKSFFDTYVSASTELVINAQMKPQFKQVILGFNNLVSLQSLIRRYINYKTGEQVNVQRPKKYVLPYLKRLDGETMITLPENEKVETYISMTAAQKAMMDDIISYVEGKISLNELKIGAMSGAGTDDIDDEEGGDRTEGVEVDFDALDEKEKLGVKIIRGLTFSSNLALSPFLYQFSGMRNPSYRDYIETSPKLKYVMECIRTVKQWHEKRKEPVSGQVIYMDRGVEYFDLIKKYLVEEVGYKPHEVGIIKSGLPKNGPRSKEYIKNLFNGEIYNESTKLFDQVSDEERVKIVIGSGTIKEGINLQKYGTVLYNCFLDWNPTDIQQLEGRVYRQGNTFNAVRIANPLMVDSADIFRFQKLQEKTSRLNSIWATDGRSNVLNTEEFNPADLKYELIRDPKIVAELKTIDETSRIDSNILGHDRLIENANRIKEVIHTIEYKLDDAKDIIKDYRNFESSTDKIGDAERLVALILDVDKKGTDIQGRKIYDDWEKRQMRPGEWNDKKMVLSSSGGYSSNTTVRKFYKPYWFGDFALAVRDFKKMYTTFLLPNRIDFSFGNTKGIDGFVEEQKKKIEELKEGQAKLKSAEYLEQITKEIIAEREEKKIVYKSIADLVSQFTRLNWLLGEKKVHAVVKQLSASCPPMVGNVRLIDEDSIAQLENCVKNQTETKVLHIDANNQYLPERRVLHAKIIKEVFEHVSCIRSGKPLAIFTGGAPGSGKSTYLKTIPWLMDKTGQINPNIFHLDADDIRAKLPEYSGWNASTTHRETQDIVNELLNKLGHANCMYDFLYDGTMNSAQKYFELIKKVKAMGYETFIIFMDVPYSVSKQRALDRYKKRGRYVPMEVIDDFFTVLPGENKTKGQYALDQLKSVVDGYVVVDGVTGNIIDHKGENLPKNRYYKKENVVLIPKSEKKLAANEKPAKAPAGGTKPKVRAEVKPEVKSGVQLPSRQLIEKQVKALKIAAEFAPDKKLIEKQIKALKIALEFAA